MQSSQSFQLLLTLTNLGDSGIANGKTKQIRGLRVAFHFELNEASGVALNRLAHLSLHTVQLHAADHSVFLESTDLSETITFCRRLIDIFPLAAIPIRTSHFICASAR